METEVLYAEVGQQIRRIRRERRLTQERLATLTALTRTSITNIESGRQKILLHTLYNIASALSVEPTTLIPRLNTDPVGVQDIEQPLSGKVSQDELEWIRAVIAPERKETDHAHP